MKSRPEIFIALIVGIALLAGGLGYGVINQSNKTRQAARQESTQTQPSQQKSATEGVSKDIAQEDTSTELPSATEAPSTEAAGNVSVYFSKNPESEDDVTQVFPVSRAVYANQQSADVAVTELIAGPTSSEKAEGYYGGLRLEGQSSCDNKDFVITQQGTVLELKFCRNVDIDAGDKKRGVASNLLATLNSVLGQSTGIKVVNQEGKCIFDDEALCKQ